MSLIVTAFESILFSREMVWSSS